MRTENAFTIKKDLIALRDEWLKNPDYDCFWSSPSNGQGLRLTPKIEPGKLTVEMTIAKHQSGFPGISHGGIPFTIIDGMMSWYLMGHYGRGGFTREATISYSRPLFVGQTYRFEVAKDPSSTSDEHHVAIGGSVYAAGSTSTGEPLISMTAKFVLPDRKLAEKVLGKKAVEAAKDIFPEV